MANTYDFEAELDQILMEELGMEEFMENFTLDNTASESFDDFVFEKQPVAEPVPEINFVVEQVSRPDPSDINAVDKQEEFDLTAGGELLRSDRRNANKKPPKRACLTDKERKRFTSSMYVDKMTIPMKNDRLDINRISKELARTGKQARGLSTIVVSRSSLVSSIEAGHYEAFGTVFENVEMTEMLANIYNLVGHIIPVFGQMRQPPATGLGPKSLIYQNHSPISDEYHPFAFEPVIISTNGETNGDSGEIVCQGIIVSNKGINYQTGDPRRVSSGRRSEFEESLCWVLITHVYFPFITYASIGPHKTRRIVKNDDGSQVYALEHSDHKNNFDDVFKWNEFMMTHTHLRACGVSTFGFTDTKQTGKDIARRLFPWSIEYSRSILDWFRRNNELDRFLIETDMTLAGKRANAREDNPSGIDVRRFLLAELLMSGTPLEPMLFGQDVFFKFDAPKIEDGGEGTYRRLLDFNTLKSVST